jgi:hypothetical protein
VTRPRAADDFPAIRARLEELQRERRGGGGRDEASAADDSRAPIRRPWLRGPRSTGSPGPLLPMQRTLFKRLRVETD